MMLHFSDGPSLPKSFTRRSYFRPLVPIRTSTSDLSPAVVTTAANASLKSCLQNGQILYGIFLLSFSPTIAEIAGLAGYDFSVIDMEHGPGGITDALHCLRALGALPEGCPTRATKALDLGPQGIMFPMIDSAKSARKGVSYCRFPPQGVRGSAHTGQGV